MKIKSIVTAIFISISIILVACSPTGNNTTQPKPPVASMGTPLSTPYFPIQKSTIKTYLTDGAPGRLILENGYLRLQRWSLLDSSYTNQTVLPIWPYGYSLDNSGGKIQVKDAKGQPIAVEGDFIVFGGGIEPDNFINQFTNQPLPSDGKGPYWVVAPQNYPFELAPLYPSQSGAKIDYPLRSVEGTLSVDKCYLILDTMNGLRALLVWPKGYTFHLKNYLIQVIDESNQPVANVGGKLKIHYAELPPEMWGKYTGQSGWPIDWQSIPGTMIRWPSWLVSEVIR